MKDAKQISPEIARPHALQEIASDYIVSPTSNDDEKVRKMFLGLFVEVDPITALRDIPERVGGYKNGERRRKRARSRQGA